MGEAGEPEAEVEDDAGTKLSMSEKLALFNKLSQPILGAVGSPVRDGSPLEASERRRQKGARYRTQPITVDEVNLVSIFGVHEHIALLVCDHLAWSLFATCPVVLISVCQLQIWCP